MGIVVAVVAMGISGVLLYLAQREISLGTSYAVWTGIGAAGTFLIGVCSLATRMRSDAGSASRSSSPACHAQARALKGVRRVELRLGA